MRPETGRSDFKSHFANRRRSRAGLQIAIQAIVLNRNEIGSCELGGVSHQIR